MRNIYNFLHFFLNISSGKVAVIAAIDRQSYFSFQTFTIISASLRRVRKLPN